LPPSCHVVDVRRRHPPPPGAQWFVHTCTTSVLSCHAETYSQQFIHFKTLLSMWHASFVTRCARPTSATTASIFLVEATDTPVDLIRREAIQRPADSRMMRRLTPDDSASAQMHQWELVSVAYAYGDATSLSASLTIRFYDPGPAGLGRLCPAVGAVESRTTQWEVPSVLGFRVESGLLLHFSVPAFLSQLVPRFCGTRPSPFVFGSDGVGPCEDERMHVLGHVRCPRESI